MKSVVEPRNIDSETVCNGQIVHIEPQGALVAVQEGALRLLDAVLLSDPAVLRSGQYLSSHSTVLPWDKIVLGLTVLTWPMDPNRRWVRDPTNVWMTLFLLVIIVSSALATYPSISWSHWFDFLDWYVIYFLIINMVTTGERYFIFMAIFLWPISSSPSSARARGPQRGFGFTSWGYRWAAGIFQQFIGFFLGNAHVCAHRIRARAVRQAVCPPRDLLVRNARCGNWSNVCSWRQQPWLAARFGLPGGVDRHSA